MKKILKRFGLFAIVVPGMSLCFSCKKDSNPPAFSAQGFWIGSFFSGATMAVLNRPDGSGRLYLLTTLGQDTSTNSVKLDGTYSVLGDVFAANYIDTSGTTYVNVQSTHTSANSLEGVFFLNGSSPAGNSVETFNFQLVKH